MPGKDKTLLENIDADVPDLEISPEELPTPDHINRVSGKNFKSEKKFKVGTNYKAEIKEDISNEI